MGITKSINFGTSPNIYEVLGIKEEENAMWKEEKKEKDQTPQKKKKTTSIET